MQMLEITQYIHIPMNELHFSFARSQGPGGQHVNKVETAVHLRFNVLHSPSLPEETRARILQLLSNRISQEGDIIIKAGNERSQERNKKAAIARLIDLLKSAAILPKKRKKTKVSFASKQKRLEQKRRTSTIKKLRSLKDE